MPVRRAELDHIGSIMDMPDNVREAFLAKRAELRASGGGAASVNGDEIQWMHSTGMDAQDIANELNDQFGYDQFDPERFNSAKIQDTLIRMGLVEGTPAPRRGATARADGGFDESGYTSQLGGGDGDYLPDYAGQGALDGYSAAGQGSAPGGAAEEGTDWTRVAIIGGSAALGIAGVWLLVTALR